MSPSFFDWLLEQRGRQDPVGDIAEEVFLDGTQGCLIPGSSAEEIELHIGRLHSGATSRGALRALRQAVAEWESGDDG